MDDITTKKIVVVKKPGKNDKLVKEALEVAKNYKILTYAKIL